MKNQHLIQQIQQLNEDLELKEEDKNEIKNELIKSESKKKVKYSKIISKNSILNFSLEETLDNKLKISKAEKIGKKRKRKEEIPKLKISSINKKKNNKIKSEKKRKNQRK